jgi:hypothetical protein
MKSIGDDIAEYAALAKQCIEFELLEAQLGKERTAS